MFRLFVLFTVQIMSCTYCFGFAGSTSSIFPPPLSRYERFSTLKKGHTDTSYVPSVFSPKSTSINISVPILGGDEKTKSYYSPFDVIHSISSLNMPSASDIVTATFILNEKDSNSVRLRIPVIIDENETHTLENKYRFEISVRYQTQRNDSELVSITTNNFAWGDVLKTEILGVSPIFSFFKQGGQMSTSDATNICQELFLRELEPGFGSPRSVLTKVTGTMGHVVASEGDISSTTTVIIDKVRVKNTPMTSSSSNESLPYKAKIHTYFNVSFNCSCNGGAGVINLGMSGNFEEVLDVIIGSLQYIEHTDTRKYATAAFTRPIGKAPTGVFLRMWDNNHNMMNLVGGFQSGPRGAFCQKRTGICPSASSKSVTQEDVTEGKLNTLNKDFEMLAGEVFDSTYNPNPCQTTATGALRRALYSIDASLGEIYREVLLNEESLTKYRYRPIAYSDELPVSSIIRRISEGITESVDSSIGPVRCDLQVKYPYYRMTAEKAINWPEKIRQSLTGRIPSIDMGPYIEDCAPDVIKCHVSDQESIPIYVPITIHYNASEYSKLPAYISITISRRHVSLSCPLCSGGELSVNYPVPFIPISLLRKPTHSAAIFQYNIDNLNLSTIDEYLASLDSVMAEPLTYDIYEAFYKPHVKIISQESDHHEASRCTTEYNPFYPLPPTNTNPVVPSCDIDESCSSNGCCKLSPDTQLGNKYKELISNSFRFPVQKSPCMCFNQPVEGYYKGPKCDLCINEFTVSLLETDIGDRSQNMKCIHNQEKVVVFLSELSTRAIAMTIPSLVIVCIFMCINILRMRWLSDVEFLITKRRRVGLPLVDIHGPVSTHQYYVDKHTVPQRPSTSMSVVNRRRVIQVVVKTMELMPKIDSNER